MTAPNSKFPRSLRVLIIMVLLAILIWVFAANTPYYYYCIGVAAIIAAVGIFLTYRKPSIAKKSKKKTAKNPHGESEEDMLKAEFVSETLKPGDIASKPEVQKAADVRLSQASKNIEGSGESPIPLIDDRSSLTPDEKNLLVNAVWYRCENPYCKYTSFLSVHHIVEQKDGGTNELNNLIVLCPFCHDLAHRGEIPEKEMQDWIRDRAKRWKFKPEWRYF
jgi:hypothetical protein